MDRDEWIETYQPIGSDTITELREKVKGYEASEWQKIHQVIQNFQTDSWSWSETNWDD